MKKSEYQNVNVTLEDRNDSFAPNKVNRSMTVKFCPEENHFLIQTPQPQVRSEPTPPVYELKEYGMVVQKLKSGYKVNWSVNVQQTKTAGAKKVKAAICDCVDVMFGEIEKNKL